MSKVIIVGDTFVSVDIWRQAVEMMDLPEPVAVSYTHLTLPTIYSV